MSDEDYIFCCNGESKACQENGRCYDTATDDPPTASQPLTTDLAFQIGYDKAQQEALEVLTQAIVELEQSTFQEPFKSGLIAGLEEALERLRTNSSL